ncbi:MAG: 2,4-dihydroxyhept-2-ene-1,7-dioic acid aldolase [Betaproteobacteria bacterium]|nr:2,4-dihydroxyhept-2-ene-1,7-dioic acid aldolase [Betaproteobacteria bacterium]
MRENTIKSIWKKGGAVINGWLGIPSSIAAENMAQAGWDGLTVDLQHGHLDYQVGISMLQAIATTNTTPLARVPWCEPGIIMKMLDAGAYGIICPMINTRAECEAFVGACRYPPRGYRSFGPVRATWYGGADYFKHANETLITMAMIETKQAMDNLDEILSVPGLDSLYVGPNDLAISLGYPPSGVPTDKVVLDAIKTIMAGAKKHGIYAGIHCGSTAMAKEMIAQGYQFVTLMADNAFLASAAKAAVAEMRQVAPSASKPSGTY